MMSDNALAVQALMSVFGIEEMGYDKHTKRYYVRARPNGVQDTYSGKTMPEAVERLASVLRRKDGSNEGA